MGRDLVKKAAYDKARREAKRAEIRAYDVERNRARRADPAYAAAQVERKRVWRAANRERHLASARASDVKRRKEDLQYRLSKNLRTRLWKALAGLGGASAVQDLGTSIDGLRTHLESLFKPGMSWDNYGEWHIDHKQPLKLFDLSDATQAKAACHYTNLQPLWALENQQKWCKQPVEVAA